MVVEITEQSKFDDLVKSEKPFVIVLGAEWCAPAKTICQHLSSAASIAQTASVPDLARVYVDVEKVPKAPEYFDNVDAIPVTIFVRQSSLAAPQNVVAMVEGADLSKIDLNVNSLFGGKQKSDFKSLNEYLEYAVKRDKIVVGLTGSPSMPRCGFTSKLIDLLEKKIKVPGYTFLDIMADEEVCQGLKKLFDWPTYPQVYVSGELIGGLDICLQMHEKGELAKVLLSS